MKIKKKHQSILHSGIKLFAVLFCLLVWQTAADAQTLKGDFRFQNNLNSTGVTNPVTMTPLGAGSYQSAFIDGYTRTTYRFPQNNGLTANTAGSTVPDNNYTIAMLVKFDTVTGRRRIYDPKQGTSDQCGLYVTNGRLVVNNVTGSTTIPPLLADTWVQIAIVRQTNSAIQIYQDGYLAFAGTDTVGCFVINNLNPRFFRDDTTEATAGNIARLRFYNAAMSSAQVRALERLNNAGGGGDQGILFTSYRDGNGEIYSMNAGGTNQRRITANNINESGGRWSPDKTKIIFSRSGTNVSNIYSMNADGSNQVQLTSETTGTISYNASWKPDGSQIIFSRCNLTSGICDLYTMNPDGSNPQPFPLVAQVDDRDYASYSPDGSKIVFTEYQNATNRTRIYTINSDASGTLNPLTQVDFPMYDFQARWSPDGTRIAFTRDTDFNTSNTAEIYVMNAADGGNLTRLTTSPSGTSSFTPIWSPDSSRLAFSSSRDNLVEVYTMNAADGGNISRLTFDGVSDVASDWFTGRQRSDTLFDFDGDGKADVSVFRPSNGTWYVKKSTSGFSATPFGTGSDKLAPADYDGDGITDIAVWRENSSNPGFSYFYILESSTGTVRTEQFGQPDDDPSVVGDWDGDGKADPAVYRNGADGSAQSFFFYRPSSQPGVSFKSIYWGAGGDKPMRGDFDGDGRTDAAVFRPSNLNWYILQSNTGQLRADRWGLATDRFVPADYDGDGKTDLAVFRNGTWYIKQSSNNQPRYETFGAADDTLVPADYDGDGKVDIAVFRNGTWYLQQSTAGFAATFYGASTDVPIPSFLESGPF